LVDSTFKLSDDVKLHIEDTDDHEFLMTMSSVRQGALVDATVSRDWLRVVALWLLNIATEGVDVA